MTLYEQNLQVLFQVNAFLAGKLFALKTNEKFEVFVDEKDPLNINIFSNLCEKALYEDVPIRQTEQQLEQFGREYKRYPFLYFFGMGNGVFYKAFLQSEVFQRIVIVEPELEILYMALHFNDFTQEIGSGRLLLVLAEDITFALASEIFMQPESRLFSKTYQFHTLLPFYEQEYETLILAINRIFLRAIEHAVRGLGNDSTDALIGLNHQVANINKMLQTPTVTELINKIKNSNTAVIVSTGPSLKKQLPLLKTIKDHATLFCIDSSLPILEKEGIKPDIVVSLERVIATAKFYRETSKEFQEDIVFAITSIAHPDLFKEIKAGTLQISMRPFGYTSYFEMPEYGYIGIGMSAANMAFELIFHGGFENCIFIGQDLAYGKDGSTHSDGHLYGATEEKVSKQVRYEVPAYGGEGVVKTTLVWKLFKNFFETDIMHANAKGMNIVNSTEGGARIEGTIEMPFAHAIGQYVDFKHKKEQIILSAPSRETIDANVEKASTKIKELLSYAIKAQRDVEEVFLHVATECEKIDVTPENERYEKLDYQALADTMAKIDRIKEYFADQKFANIFTDATQALILHQEIQLATIQVRNVTTDDEKRQKMIDWILAHRYWLFSLAGMMQATIDAVNMGLEMSIEFEAIECVRVYVNDKEVDVLHVRHEDALMNNLFDIKQMCIDYVLDETHDEIANSVKFFYSNTEKSFEVEVHMPRKDDTHFNEFAFMNSLEATIDKEKIENLYEKGVIGFLATEENLEDEEFIEYIKELEKRFSNVSFKIFYLNNEQKRGAKEIFKNFINIKFIFPKNIYHINENCLIWLSRNDTLSLSIRKHIRYALFINFEAKNLSIQDYENKYKDSFKMFYENPSKFGEKDNSSFFGVAYNNLIKSLDSNLFIDINANYFEFSAFRQISLALKYNKFIDKINNLSSFFQG